jgi:hypothetical protein
MPLLLASAAAPALRDPEAVARSVDLFAIVAALLGAFMLLVILLSWGRARRLARQRRSAAGSTVTEHSDAWAEAGRRAEGFRRESDEGPRT